MYEVKTPQAYERNTWFVYLMLTCALYFPVTQFELFHILAILLALSLFILNSKVSVSLAVAVIALLVTSPLVASVFNVFVNDTVAIRDLTEFVRFIPALIILLHAGKIEIKEHRLINFFLLYMAIVLIVSFFQIANASLVAPITNLYGSEHHIERALALDRRSLGLSAGPGQNGAIAAITYSFALAYFCLTGAYKKRTFLLMLTSVLVVLLSQSQTAFIVIIGISIYAVLYFLIQGGNEMKARAWSIFYVMLAFLAILIYTLFDKIKYLLTLFTLGFSRNSFQERLHRTDEALGFVEDSPFQAVYGLGKETFGSLSSAMDNEFVFFLGVYGFIAFAVVIALYALNFIFCWLFPARFINRKLLLIHFVVVAGMVTSWATMFLTDPRMLIILAVLITTAMASPNLTIKKHKKSIKVLSE